MVDAIKLPCSIGDEVYIRWSRLDGRIYKETVRSVLLDKDGLSINTDNFIGGDWLEDIFPTQEAAFESARNSGYKPVLEVEKMSVYPEIEEIANHVSAIDELVDALCEREDLESFMYDWTQAEIVELSPANINHMISTGGLRDDRYVWKSEYCRTCTYFRTSSPGKYVRVPLVEE